MKRPFRLLVLPLVLMASWAIAQQRQAVNYPAVDEGEDSLAQRHAEQLASAGDIGVFHDFKFVDRLPESGITFVHRVVTDAAKTYKMAHYDHGNGVAVADVDADGLLDLYFVTQIGSNELWRNLGGGRFENITERAGVGQADRIAVGASFADIDNDGDADLFVTSVRGGNALFENDGTGTFRDISTAAGVDYVGHSSGATFLDYDGDGLLDLFVSNVGVYTTEERGEGGFYFAFPDAFNGHTIPERFERSILYRNLGESRFRDVSSEVGLVDNSWNGDATLVDFNGDSFPDLYLTNMQGDDHYYENSGGRLFTQRTAEVFPLTPWGAMGIKSFDFDNDDDLDLFLTDMHSDMLTTVGPTKEFVKPNIPDREQFYQDSSNNLLGNGFYRNNGDGSFDEMSDALGLENFWPWGTSAGDLNADGWQDVFIVSSMGYPFRYHINSVMLNDRAEHFAQSEFLLGVEPRRDGRIRTDWYELYCSDADWQHELCVDMEGTVTVLGTLGSRSSALVDIDNDGDLDIITSEFGAEPQFLISDLSDQRDIHWLKVGLQGSFSNRDALGAKVTVHVGDKTYTRFHDGKSGYLAQSSGPLYFGLGESSSIDSIVVLWPSGAEQVVNGPLDTNRLILVQEEE